MGSDTSAKWVPTSADVVLNISAALRLYRGFKALKQTVKLHYRLGNHSEMMTAYREMLTYIK